MTQDEIIAAAAETIARRMQKEIEVVIRKYLASAAAPTRGYKRGQLAWFVSRASRYAHDARYGAICATGLMPHSKLLKLSKMKAEDMRTAIEQAIQSGQIEECCDPASGLMCYRIPGQMSAPQPDLTALDDPEQDSHTWDFGKALERARLEREM